MKKLPIGIQSIRQILEEDKVYIDKTGFALDLIENGKHYFISRPRRFGKSLFLSTLEEIFKGNQALFKGLAIDRSDYDWKEYPVLRFDFSQISSSSLEKFEMGLEAEIKRIGILNKISVEGPSIEFQLKVLVESLSSKNRVVVLVDEYDSAIINHLKHPEIGESNRDLLKAFFATLKSLDEFIKFTFVTGVSKFSQVSLFSGPNHLKDITMHPKYATMMGYTEEELKLHFKEYIQRARATRVEQGLSISEEEIFDEIRSWYNGYRFSEGKSLVYNPFSTLNFMEDQKAESYWYSSGTPSFLMHELKKHSKSMVSLDGTTATKEQLMDISRLDKIDLTALMYQTGYFTIKDYHPISKRYYLGLPNKEVRGAFFNTLLENFSPMTPIKSSETYFKALESHDPGFLFDHLGLGFASFAYQVFIDAKESTYHGMLLAMLYGMGFEPLSEQPTHTGRIDVVFEVSNTVYIIELKLNSNADLALKQIYDKEYFKPYTHKGKSIVLLGANFSSKLRNISEWKGELLSESGEKIKDIIPEKES